MKTYAPPFTALVLVLMLTGPTVHAAPLATADAAIAYHTLPTAAPVRTDHPSYSMLGASIRSLVSGLGKTRTLATDDNDRDTWHSQWKRQQQQERRCNLWDVCVDVYDKVGEWVNRELGTERERERVRRSQVGKKQRRGR
jgi:hypothetical protein